jgi:hypothetical protein
MCSADTVGEVKAVDPMEALLLQKTTQRVATVKTWQSSSRPVRQSKVACFEGTCAVGHQTLGDLFSILKEGPVHDGFASLLATSNELFEEFAHASILTRHKKWCECVFTLEPEHQEGFDKVCQRILGNLFGMFEASLFAPKTTNKAKCFLHVLHCL